MGSITMQLSSPALSFASTQSHTPLRGLRCAADLSLEKPHGVRVRYMAGCRCIECRRANTAYETARSVARKAGDWNGVVPAERARGHLLALSQAGIGRRQVSHITGISGTILMGITNGARPKLRARSERAILAVTGQAVADGALVDAGPTWKLLDQLIAWGYTKAHLARELGCKAALQVKRTQCTVRKAYDVQLLHARLRRVDSTATSRLLASLREEGYRKERIASMVASLATSTGRSTPDLKVYGSFISASAAELVARLHEDLTGDCLKHKPSPHPAIKAAIAV